jgi:hypothetical protein
MHEAGRQKKTPQLSRNESGVLGLRPSMLGTLIASQPRTSSFLHIVVKTDRRIFNGLGLVVMIYFFFGVLLFVSFGRFSEKLS